MPGTVSVDVFIEGLCSIAVGNLYLVDLLRIVEPPSVTVANVDGRVIAIINMLY